MNVKLSMRREIGRSWDDQTLAVTVHRHPDADAPPLFLMDWVVGGVSQDYLSRDDAVRVVEAMRSLLLRIEG